LAQLLSSIKEKKMRQLSPHALAAGYRRAWPYPTDQADPQGIYRSVITPGIVLSYIQQQSQPVFHNVQFFSNWQ
jgi:hypothetical protein